mgnify:CR=1 FL=1
MTVSEKPVEFLREGVEVLRKEMGTEFFNGEL